MRIEYYEYHNVNPDGTVDGERGAYEVKPGLLWSHAAHQTKSTKEDGLFLRVSKGRDPDGVTRCMTVFFDSEEEFEAFMRRGKLNAYT